VEAVVVTVAATEVDAAVSAPNMDRTGMDTTLVVILTDIMDLMDPMDIMSIMAPTDTAVVVSAAWQRPLLPWPRLLLLPW